MFRPILTVFYIMHEEDEGKHQYNNAAKDGEVSYVSGVMYIATVLVTAC